ncbi:MAG: DUF6775 family putative metallopeptidase [Halobacteriaceae archaeon]
MTGPERVSLYRAPTTAADADALADWLRDRVDATVDVRDRFLDGAAERGAADADAADADGAGSLAREFARARVLSPHDRETGNEMLGIVRYEQRALADPERGGGVLYDGLAVQDALRERLPADERGLDHAHVVLTDRVLGSWGEHDGRWHKRVCVLGQPALVSVPGLYEAPAKPEAYYKAKQRHAMLSGDAPPREVLEEQVEGEFLVAEDPRTTEALRGSVLAAVHYLATGEAFCDDESCALYNAHHQEDLVAAQLREPLLCPTHAERYG